jgi:hypothetical protein
MNDVYVKKTSLLEYLFEKPLSFVAFFLGKIPVWVLFYLYFFQRIDIYMALSILTLIYMARSYFDVDILGINPIYSIFSSLFYSTFKTIIYISILMFLYILIILFFFTYNYLVYLLFFMTVLIFFAGISIFFKKDLMDSVWNIKNIPLQNSGIIKGFFITLCWFVVITTPLHISILGLIIIYTLEYKGLSVKISDMVSI